MGNQKEDMNALLSYKFNGVEKSFLVEYCQLKYWERILDHIPPWVAPNAITLIGFLAMAAQTLFVFYLDPALMGNVRWLPALSAAVIWFYSTMDCIDGMQARKTGAKSPLGQLFDHGVDSVVCTFIVYCLASALGIKNKKTVLAMLVCSQTVFYWVTTKEYYTKLFYLGFIGPTECIAMVCILLIVISAAGKDRVVYFNSWATKNFDALVQGVCVSAWVLATAYYIWDIAYCEEFGMVYNSTKTAKAMQIVPHFLFVLTQVISGLCIASASQATVSQVFYPYIGLYTMCFSMFTTLTIKSHQLSTKIMIPNSLIALTIIANLLLVFSAPKKTHLSINIVFVLGLTIYTLMVKEIIEGYLKVLKIPFFFNNYKGK
ncbi:ethanolaminephosphotransferase [Nematocida major]|uniref:ethanolaminephosphotransferase n=1 Tax=Nematocida major TaxID=1912982 RepID=UPI002007431D|nr:ethanolaminephosphotransferase [Nematocida major]KAH9385447.1 ethanolaminephosphotransferase [Nematocida major]